MRIVTNPSIAEHEGGTFWAGIYVEHDGHAFPESVWDDIAIGVLYEWGVQCEYLIENEGVTLPLSFFDGPYYLQCSLRGDDLSVDWINDGSRPTVERTFKASMREFLESYIAAFDGLHAAYAKLSLTADDASTEAPRINSCLRSREVLSTYLRRAPLAVRPSA